MAISEYKTGSATISTAEYSLVTPGTTLATDTTDGVFQVFVDLSAMTATETYDLKIYEKVTSGGSKQVVYEARFQGSQGGPFVSPSLILINGWDVTMYKYAGTDRSIAWSIRQVA